MQQEVEWLMGFPLGLKTNDNLNHILGQSIIHIIFIWENITTYFNSIERYIIQSFAYFNLLGLSISLVLVSDFLDFLNMHLKFLYLVLSKIYKLIFSSLVSHYRITQDYTVSNKTIKVRVFEWD